ncbi:MAG: membrane protein insertion efficiency factor YidD [Deltaproteobacteria bacterium]|nr:MAG: membrane protein insertion efficiency factor YidD [Deltaproteobacteria bacterium]
MPKRPPSSSGSWRSSRTADDRPDAIGRLLTLLLRAYQLFLRPTLAPACRFTPSCSAFAREAIELHGARRGTLLAARRLLRCHPWNPGGYDPVPERPFPFEA